MHGLIVEVKDLLHKTSIVGVFLFHLSSGKRIVDRLADIREGVELNPGVLQGRSNGIVQAVHGPNGKVEPVRLFHAVGVIHNQMKKNLLVLGKAELLLQFSC